MCLIVAFELALLIRRASMRLPPRTTFSEDGVNQGAWLSNVSRSNFIAHRFEDIVSVVGRNASRTPLCFVLLMSGLVYTGSASAEQDRDPAIYHRAVEYCRGDVVRPMMLSPDKKILCFDGRITDLNESHAASLEEGGLFVVRSLEGVGVTALAIAHELLRRRATVVIYDYCLSACATYFFFASVRTYVLKGALIVWHAGGGGTADCPTLMRPFPDELGSMIRAPCDALPGGPGDGYGKYVLARRKFYTQRSNAAESPFPPISPHIAKTLINMYRDTGVPPNVAWTLSPTSLHSFKTEIHYEAYPANQNEVDEMASRLEVSLRLGVQKVIYDR